MAHLFNRTWVLAALLAFGLSGSAIAAGSDSFGADTPSAADKLKNAAKEVKSENWRSAIALLRDVLREDKDNADALNYMGFSHRKLGEYNKALTYYTRALEVDPTHKGANEYIGEAYLALKQPEKALVHLKVLEKSCGKSCEEYLDLREAYDAYQKKAGKSS